MEIRFILQVAWTSDSCYTVLRDLSFSEDSVELERHVLMVRRADFRRLHGGGRAEITVARRLEGGHPVATGTPLRPDVRVLEPSAGIVAGGPTRACRAARPDVHVRCSANVTLRCFLYWWSRSFTSVTAMKYGFETQVDVLENGTG